MYRRHNNRIFSKGRISDIFQKRIDSVSSAINRETENYILNVNVTSYIDHLKSTLLLNTPIIHFDEVFVDNYEDDVPAEYFPQMWHVEEGEKHKMTIIQFIIPVTGDIGLLRHSPASSISLGGGDFEVRENSIVTEFINFSNDGSELKGKYNTEVNAIRKNYETLVKDIQAFNLSLKSVIESKLNERKDKILNKNNVLSSLGIPLRKKENVAATFAIPKPILREKIIVKPVVHEKGFAPEPTIDEENYLKILKVINDVGKNFERMPSVYKGKGEEDLRDHILMNLDPNFEFGSASGETFNKTGKTDIQLRYTSSVVFIAECKFWGGEKKYLATIDQLLNYLTWRDTKASVIVFVRQKDFSAVLQKVRIETQKHANYLSYVNMNDENWLNFRFHINGDRNRELKLAIQLYHLPD